MPRRDRRITRLEKWAFRRFPALQVVPAWATAIGPLPEHSPWWARQPGRPGADTGSTDNQRESA